MSKAVVIDLHDRQRLEFGGPPGLRDEGLLDSALDRPKNIFAYGNPDLAALAAAYAFGLARNHPFVDGNKRVSFITTELFLNLNGRELIAADDACVTTWLALAAGTLDEARLAEWLRDKTEVPS